MEKKHSAEKAVREIRRKNRRRLSAEEKVRLEPCLDLLVMGSQLRLGLPWSRLARHRAGALGHRDRQHLVRLAVTRLPAQPARDLEPTPDRRTAMARATLDRPLWLVSGNPAQNLKNLPHPDLPVRHLRCLLGSQDWLTRSLGVGSRS